MGDYRRLQPPPTVACQGPRHRKQGEFRVGDTARFQLAPIKPHSPPDQPQTARRPGQVHALLHPEYASRKAARVKKPKRKVLRLEGMLIEKMGSKWNMLRTAFRTIDEDKSGFIDKEEFSRVFSMFNIPCTKTEVEKLWGQYDKNNDGELDYLEFLSKFGQIC